MSSNPPSAAVVALIAVIGVNVAAAWYPFALDPPRDVRNTATAMPDGSWRLDASSWVTGTAPAAVEALLVARRFELSIAADLEKASQRGPARLISIGRSPHDATFMVGIDGGDLVVYLPCGGSSSNLDAAWRVPLPRTEHVSARVHIDIAALEPVGIEILGEPLRWFENHCPDGLAPRLPDLDSPWALGNVFSAHRPFEGLIRRVQIRSDERSVDLLREVRWEAPAVYRVWPERLYERSMTAGGELVPALLHFLGFFAIGLLLMRLARRLPPGRALAFAAALSVVLTVGKVLVMGRHPQLLDVAVNLAGAASAIYVSSNLFASRV